MTSAGFQFSPGVFKVKDADPEQTLESFELYLEAMQKAFRLNRRVNPTTGSKVEFVDQDKKDIIQLEGGHDMVDLIKHSMCGRCRKGILECQLLDTVVLLFDHTAPWSLRS